MLGALPTASPPVTLPWSRPPLAPSPCRRAPLGASLVRRRPDYSIHPSPESAKSIGALGIAWSWHPRLVPNGLKLSWRAHPLAARIRCSACADCLRGRYFVCAGPAARRAGIARESAVKGL